MKIYNTLSRQKEELVPIKDGEVKIYACGPTVYNFIHIGNARPICVFDALRRYLEFRGLKVTYVQNFTDIDDKLIKRANEEGSTVPEIAAKYIAEYEKDALGLNVRPATHHPKATDNIGNIIKLVKNLEQKGFAYAKNNDVYFRTKKFSEYGKLSHMPIDDLESGARIDVNDQKEDALDFVLWKAAKEGEPFWQSPWGKGRPGWHIECSAMVGGLLGDTIDIHCGGQDLIFPHHENEIAQSECATGRPFANYWMHNGYINVDNKKMSKSLNNFFTTRDVAEKFGYEPIRFMMLSAHYRSPINYSLDVINQSISALDRLYTCRENLEFALKSAEDNESDDYFDILYSFNQKKQEFIDALDDDFNTADAISVIFELAREIYTLTTGEVIASKRVLEAAKFVFDELCDGIGILYNKKEEEIPKEVLDLVEKRAKARQDKDYKLADDIRNEITALGYVLEETRQGTKITLKN